VCDARTGRTRTYKANTSKSQTKELLCEIPWRAASLKSRASFQAPLLASSNRERMHGMPKIQTMTRPIPGKPELQLEELLPSGPVPVNAEVELPSVRTLWSSQEVGLKTPIRPIRCWEAVGSATRTFVKSVTHSRPKRRDYPSRLHYFEDSLLSREMDRL
jgi:hypothetical protein